MGAPGHDPRFVLFDEIDPAAGDGPDEFYADPPAWLIVAGVVFLLILFGLAGLGLADLLDGPLS